MTGDKEGQQSLVLKVLLILTSVITIAAVGANLGLFGEGESVTSFAKWGMTSVLGFIITAAVGISKDLFTEGYRLHVPIVFENKEPGEVLLDPARCKYELRDEDYRVTKEDTVIPVEEGAGWVCILPAKTRESNTITLYLQDEEDTIWRVGPFRSSYIPQTAKKVKKA